MSTEPVWHHSPSGGWGKGVIGLVDPIPQLQLLSLLAHCLHKGASTAFGSRSSRTETDGNLGKLRRLWPFWARNHTKSHREAPACDHIEQRQDAEGHEDDEEQAEPRL